MIDPKHKIRFWSLTLILVIVMAAGVLMGANTNNQRGVANLDYTFLGNYPTSGNYYFVDNQSSYAQDSCVRNGGTWDQPLNTIDAAIGCTTANNGDIIFVAAGHSENVSSESYIDMDVATTRLVGLGKGRNRSTLVWTNKSGMVEAGASNVGIENFVLDMSFNTGADTGVSVTSGATNFYFANNEVILSDKSGGKVGHAIYLSGGTGAQIVNSNFLSGLSDSVTSSAVTEVIFIASGVDDVLIKDTYIQAYGPAASGLISAASSRVSGFVLQDSTIMQANSASSGYNFSVVGLASEIVIKNVAILIGTDLTTSGVTDDTYIDLNRGPQFDDQF